MLPFTDLRHFSLAHDVTLVQALAHSARQNADKRAYIFLVGDQAPLTVTFAQVWEAAQCQAAALMAAGIGAGDFVALMGVHHPQLIAAWMGALIVGALPAICPYLPAAEPPPAPHNGATHGANAEEALDVTVTQGLRYVRKSRARAILTPAAWQGVIGAALAAESECLVLPLEAGAGHSIAPDQLWQLPVQTDDYSAIAYVQLSSGTTGEMKGIPISHRAVLAHLQSLQAWLALDSESVGAGWVPLSHDMGLIAQMLLPWSVGFPFVTLAPHYWLVRPRTLLRAISTYGVTMTTMPTFGYAHSTQHIRDEDMEGVDLSSLRACIVGAEIVSAATMQAFAGRFARWGLAAQSLLPGYGMAETVGGCALTPLGRGMRVDHVEREALQRHGVARALEDAGVGPEQEHSEQESDDETPERVSWVSCGRPLPNLRIEIVNKKGDVLPERHVGQVVVYGEGFGTARIGDGQAGPGLTSGLASGLVPNLASTGEAAPGVVYTRDLGYLADGELYLCGRQDDLMILGGANVYPEAIEMTALAAIGEGAGRAAAFGVRDRRLSTETAVLVCEVRGVLPAERERELNTAIRRAVRAQHGILLGDLYLVRRGWILTGDSGKVARQATQEKYKQAGRMSALTFLPELGHLADLGPERVNDLAQALADRVALILGVTGAGKGIGIHDDVLELGLSSLTASALLTRLRRERNHTIDIEKWVLHATCAHLASLLLNIPILNTPILNTPNVGLVPAQALEENTDKFPPPAVETAAVEEIAAPASDALQDGSIVKNDPEAVVVEAERIKSASAQTSDAQEGIPPVVALSPGTIERMQPNSELVNKRTTPVPKVRPTTLSGYVKWFIEKVSGRFFLLDVKLGSLRLKGPGLWFPYGFAVSVQRRLYSLPWMQQLRFAAQVERLEQLASRLDGPPGSETILEHLMFSHGVRWREISLTNPHIAADWVQASGVEHLLAAREAGRGAILAVWHTPGNGILWEWLRAHHYATYPIQAGGRHLLNLDSLAFHWVRQLYHAGEMLEQGGIVIIATDGRYGDEGRTVEIFKGVEQTFYPGFAKLAVDYNAVLIPTRIRLETSGILRIEFMPPLTPCAGEDDPVMGLVTSYIDRYRQIISKDIGSLTPLEIERFYNEGKE